ncbi:TBC1 domain, member 5 [Podila minutissima]|uniref:TBC1 domain, member 5 n=1 Tax=Podila minutissima TaxID=64525 RepID=A0A9P5SD92_9FUNG|nr:TBC1 domain, member 5 [Podila minutissima]
MDTERSKYSELRRKYIRAVGSGDDQEPDLEVNNPLSLAEDSPWQQFFVDSELKKIIKQDVERTFPDNDYFRSEKVQEQLGDILFIYCKIHHDVSYRQGMHELAAYFLWVVSNESLDISAEGNLGTSDATFEIMKSVLDSNYIEHDTFALFSSLMSRAKPWYEFSDEGFGGARRPKPNNVAQTQLFGKPEAPEPPSKQTPVIEWSEKIFYFLERVDNELFLHLRSLEIQPQLFGIRWFRLLFGREFPMEDVLNLWDGIFAKDPSLNIVIFIGLALLLKIRDDLLDQDFSGCLHKLMRQIFPSNGVLSQHLPPAALDAIKPVAEGFVHVTKNVLESKGGAALNKAIHDMKSQLGQVVAKALVILESEFSPKADASSKNTSKEAMAAISGLEHVRDILLGFTKDLDPLVIESKMLDTLKPEQEKAPQETQNATKHEEPIAQSRTPVHNGASPSPKRGVTNSVSGSPGSPGPVRMDGQNSHKSDGRKNFSRNAQTNNGQEYRFDAGGEVYSGSVHTSPALAPVQAIPVKQSQPFSFDDLIDTSDSVPSSRHNRAKDRTSGVSGLTASNTKSSRSSIAHSQYSWMLDEDSQGGNGLGGSTPGSGSGPGSSNGTGNLRPAAEIFSPSTNSRMKLDPLAGNVSKRSTSFGRQSSTLGQQLQDDDPLRT